MDACGDRLLLHTLLDTIISEFGEMREEYETRTGLEVAGRYYRMFQASNQMSFDAMDRKSNNIFNSMIEFSSKHGNNPETKEPHAAVFVIDKLRRSYPNSLEKVLEHAKISSKVKRLSAIQTASILEDTTTSVTGLYRINRHLHAHWGIYPFCAKEDLVKFTKQDRPKLSFGTFEYEKKEEIDKKSKKGKKKGNQGKKGTQGTEGAQGKQGTGQAGQAGKVGQTRRQGGLDGHDNLDRHDELDRHGGHDGYDGYDGQTQYSKYAASTVAREARDAPRVNRDTRCSRQIRDA